MAPEQGKAPFPAVRVAATAMRTRFEILFPGDSGSAPDLRAAGEEALAEIARVESWLSVYRPDALLFAVNAAAGKGPLPIDFRLFRFLETALSLCEATDGAFDPTVGPLVALWREAGERGELPTAEEISHWLEQIGMRRVVSLDREAQTVSLAAPGVRLDVGAIGKGYALDRAADLLREAGITTALLHGGTSSVVGIGAPPDDPRGWPIATQDPEQTGERLALVRLQDQALGVSAIHGRAFMVNGRTYGHVLDPRTGYPVRSTTLAACIHPSATVADAVSTALLVLGEPGKDFLRERFPDIDWLMTVPYGPPTPASGGVSTGSPACGG